MKLSRLLFLTLATSIAYLAPAGGFTSLADTSGTGPDPGQICISVGRLLEQGHYSKHKLDDTVSRKFLSNYLDTLDFNHLFFTQKDVDTFTTKYATSLDDDVLLGNPDPATDIYNLYKKRVEDRVAKVKELLTENFDFTKDEFLSIVDLAGQLRRLRRGAGLGLWQQAREQRARRLRHELARFPARRCRLVELDRAHLGPCSHRGMPPAGGAAAPGSG